MPTPRGLQGLGVWEGDERSLHSSSSSSSHRFFPQPSWSQRSLREVDNALDSCVGNPGGDSPGKAHVKDRRKRQFTAGVHILGGSQVALNPSLYCRVLLGELVNRCRLSLRPVSNRAFTPPALALEL